jgi:CBS domain-containing protein
MGATVGDVMTTRVVAVHKDADFKQIVTALRRFRVSACPVIDEIGRVIGVVSEADLLYKEADPELPAGLVQLNWRLKEHSRASAGTAGELMTSPAIAIEPEAAVAEAAMAMQRKQVRRLPVVDEDGRLVTALNLLARIRHAEGVVSVRDRLSYPRSL